MSLENPFNNRMQESTQKQNGVIAKEPKSRLEGDFIGQNEIVGKLEE